MSKIDTDALWRIFEFIGTNWGISEICDMPRTQFVQAVDWQVERDPTYAAYYSEAVAELNDLERRYPAPAQALQVLFRENRLPEPKLPNVANHVLLEFMRWQIAFGGFRSFDYKNYAGWMGGGSFLSVPPPYRALFEEH